MTYLVKTVDGSCYRVKDVPLDFLTGRPVFTHWLEAEDGTLVSLKHVVSIKPLGQS